MEAKVRDLFEELDRGSAASDSIVASSSPAVAEASPTQVVRKKSAEEKRFNTLKHIEEELFQESMGLVRDALRFTEVEGPLKDENGNNYFSTHVPPQEWVDELGEEGAKRRLRAAQAGWMSKKDSPVAVQVASALVVGIGRSRAASNQGPKTLNVQLIQVSAPLPQFPSLRLQAGEK
jgi:hypothetical protein